MLLQINVYKLINYWLVDLGALVACQHYLQKNYRQLSRHLLIRTQVIWTIYLLTSCHFAIFADIFNDDEPGDISTDLFLYKLIIDNGMQDTFPNVVIALRMYLVLVVTNCSAERSFSKLKLIESRLRTSI